MLSATVNPHARTITYSAAFAKKIARLDAEAIKRVRELRDLYPDFEVVYAEPKNKKSNRTSYIDMVEIFSQNGRADLVEELNNRRTETSVDQNGSFGYTYKFFDNRKWFGKMCAKYGITPQRKIEDDKVVKDNDNMIHFDSVQNSQKDA